MESTAGGKSIVFSTASEVFLMQSPFKLKSENLLSFRMENLSNFAIEKYGLRIQIGF